MAAVTKNRKITRTINTLKTRLLLTENKFTTAPIIENNNDEMSTRIQNNRLLIETVLHKLRKVEAQLELNTIHQRLACYKLLFYIIQLEYLFILLF
jgi:hypothetical protein